MSRAGVLLQLVWRTFARSRLPNQRREQAGSGVLLRLFFVGGIAFQGMSVGRHSFHSDGTQSGEATLLLASIACVSIGSGALFSIPTLRGLGVTLRHPFLAPLPVSEGLRTAIEIISMYALYAFVLSAAYAWGGWILLPVVFVLSAGGALVGSAIMRLLRCGVSARRVVPLAWVANGFLLVGYTLGMVKGPFAHMPPMVPILERLAFVGRALGDGMGGEESQLAAWGLALGLCALGIAGIVTAERIGYDRVDVTPPTKIEELHQSKLRVGQIDAVLARREPGGSAQRWMGAFVMGLIAATPVILLHIVKAKGRPGTLDQLSDAHVELGRGAIHSYAVVLVVAVSLGMSQRAAARDLAARPLLAPLPIAPSDLLEGRAAFVRRRMMWLVSPLVFLLFAPLSFTRWSSVFWHTLEVVAAAWIVGGAAASIAFLASGIGTGARSRWTLANYLLYVPLFSIASADKAWRGILPLCFLALVAREARLAATTVVRWLDDDDSPTKDTGAWRALVVFGAFAALQGWIAMGIKQFWSQLDTTRLALFAYAASALILVGFTSMGRSLRDLLARPWKLHLGVLGGLVSLGCALVYRLLLDRLGVPVHNAETRTWLGTLVLAGVAPVAEEIFFRGWLQPALEERGDVTNDKHVRIKTVLLSATLFAAVHPTESFLAVFVLGLIVGTLRVRTGGISAGIVAHAMHNGGVLWL